MARPVLHADIPWIPFAPAILVAAWYGGIGPGLAAILLSVLATDYFLLEPHGALGLRTAGQATGVVVFALTGALMIALIERVRAAQAERERAGEVQRRLASIVESSEDAIIAKTLEGVVTDWNGAAERLYGYTEAEMVGCSVALLVPASHPDELPLILERIRQGERVEHFETVRVRKDGTPVAVAISVSPVRDASGTVVGASTIARDITARKREEAERQRLLEALQGSNENLQAHSEELACANEELQVQTEELHTNLVTMREQAEALHQSEARLRATFDNAGVGIVETAGEEDRFVAVNDRICRILGYSHEQLLGMTVHDLTYPEDRAASDDLNAQLHAGSCDRIDYEKRYRKCDGSPLWVHVTVSAVRDAAGRWQHSIATVEDISERKRAEETLRQSEEQLRLATLAAEIGIWSWTPGTPHVMVSANWRRLFGIAPDTDVTFETWANALHPEDRDRAVQELNAASEEHREFNTEYRVVRPDGTVRWVVDRGRAWYDESGRAIGMAGVNVDMTERKEMEEDLRGAGRRKDEFLAMLSHELRNPLAAISSAVHLMGERGLADPMLERAREVSERQSAHMGRLLDDLLDVSRVTQGRIELKQEEIDLAAVVESAVEAATPLIESKGHALDVSLPDTPLHLHGDPVRLAQVVDNLLTNAAKYTPAGGHIRLEVRSAECEVRSEDAAMPPAGSENSALRTSCFALLSVRDDGAGIAPDLLPHVFDLFAQGERSLARAEGGLGIGLTMVKRLVELHGGRVEARSGGPGKGSEFIVSLPLVGSEEPEVRSGSATSHSAPPTSHSRRVLVVDDNADMAEMLAMNLEADGHEVATALSGPAAIDLAGDYRPDLVLLDLGMPGMDGYEVARRLRQMPELAGTPLVAVTGYGQEEDVRHTREAGFDAHLVKPVDMGALRQVLAGRGSGANG